MNTFAPTEEGAVLFTASGLTASAHTLAIEVTGTKGPDPANTGTLIVVDAFEVRP